MADRIDELSALAYYMLKIKGAAWGLRASQDSVTPERVRNAVQNLVETMPSDTDRITSGGLMAERDEGLVSLYVHVGYL